MHAFAAKGTPGGKLIRRDELVAGKGQYGSRHTWRKDRYSDLAIFPGG